MITRFLNWWNGWRLDLDGWWVRARRDGDDPVGRGMCGFTEEASVAVSTPAEARALDKGGSHG